MIFSLGLWASVTQADTLEFTSPTSNARLTQGEVVPLGYKVHHNGMTKLVWAKIHLMTADGFDAGIGTISTASRDQWQDSLSLATEFRIPDSVPAGKYVFHVYGSTEQPCQGTIDISQRCEGILSETVPVEIVTRAVSSSESKAQEPKQSSGGAQVKADLRLPQRKRQLYAGRELGLPRSDFVNEDGSEDTKKMLYFFSLI
ncbi:hypothetical protein BGZ83_010823 [Gryganskiella cystojenkinii]|nr:hypothetical protein BGZ83_010823 [Gryganskiella cystojenkinii]